MKSEFSGKLSENQIYVKHHQILIDLDSSGESGARNQWSYLNVGGANVPSLVQNVGPKNHGSQDADLESSLR